MEGRLQASNSHLRQSFTFHGDSTKCVKRKKTDWDFSWVSFAVGKGFVPELRLISPMGSTSRSVNLAPSIVTFGDGAAMTVSTVD